MSDVDDLAAFGRWLDLLADVWRLDPFAGTLLSHVGLVEFAGRRLRLAVPRASVWAAGVATRRVRWALEVLGGDLEVVDAAPRCPDRPSLFEVRRRHRARLAHDYSAEAREHPVLVALALEFDARIVAVRPIAGAA